MTALLAAALAYAAAGVAVLPLVPGEKRPACRGGVHAATTDPVQVRAWWSRRPGCGVGLATGGLFDVIDVDPGGEDALGWVVVPPVFGEALTPRGRHLYVPSTGRGNRRGWPGLGLDYRGAGGYVVAAPTPGYAWARCPAWAEWAPSR